MKGVVKVFPLEYIGEFNEKAVQQDHNKFKKDEMNIWTKAKVLEIGAWYLLPVFYILFTVAYFPTYMFL